MEMTGEVRIPASREVVWAALNDPAVLKACIPGCDSLEMTSPTEMTAAVTAKVGPVKAKFTGAVTLSNIRPAEGYTISGEGKGGVAGFAKGGADVALEPDGDGTLLKYTAKAQVGGKLAQLGARLIDSTAKKMADEFFAAFSAHVGAAAATPAAPAAAAATAEDAPFVEPDDRDPVVVEEIEEEAGRAAVEVEEKLEAAAGRGMFGGPVVWGFVAVAAVAVLIWIFH